MSQTITGQRYVFKNYKTRNFSSKTSLPDVMTQCAKDCVADSTSADPGSQCKIVAAYNPKHGDNVCYFGNAAAAASAKASPDGRYMAVIMPSGPGTTAAANAAAASANASGVPVVGTQYTFQSYTSKKYDSKRSLGDVMTNCVKDCAADPNCRIVAANNPKHGDNVCYFGDQTAASNYQSKKDGRWQSAVLPPKTPPAAGSGQQYVFQAYTTKALDAGLPLAQALQLCQTDCEADRNCQIVTVNNPLGGGNTCYFGDQTAATTYKTRDDPRWMGAVLPPKAPLPPGTNEEYVFTPYRTKNYDAGLPLAQVLQLCQADCASDPKCRIVAANSPLGGGNVCNYGDVTALEAYTVNSDPRWSSAVLPANPGASSASSPATVNAATDNAGLKAETGQAGPAALAPAPTPAPAPARAPAPAPDPSSSASESAEIVAETPVQPSLPTAALGSIGLEPLPVTVPFIRPSIMSRGGMDSGMLFVLLVFGALAALIVLWMLVKFLGPAMALVGKPVIPNATVHVASVTTWLRNVLGLARVG